MNRVRLILLLSVLLLLLSACGGQQLESAAVTGPAVDPEGQLVCPAEDRDRAEEVAALYGISLAGFGNGVAVFYTEEDPQTVIDRGLVNGWPELSLNTIDSFS